MPVKRKSLSVKAQEGLNQLIDTIIDKAHQSVINKEFQFEERLLSVGSYVAAKLCGFDAEKITCDLTNNRLEDLAQGKLNVHMVKLKHADHITVSFILGESGTCITQG